MFFELSLVDEKINEYRKKYSGHLGNYVVPYLLVIDGIKESEGKMTYLQLKEKMAFANIYSIVDSLIKTGCIEKKDQKIKISTEGLEHLKNNRGFRFDYRPNLTLILEYMKDKGEITPTEIKEGTHVKATDSILLKLYQNNWIEAIDSTT